MSTDFRALITRMANELDEYRRLLLDDCTVTHRLSNEARAALADGPAVPQDREPASVTGQPSDEELLELWHGSDWYNEGATLREFCSIARAVLARWGNPAPPPADGEVAELAAWLRETGDTIQPSHLAEHQRYKRAAELLQRQVLVPVPGSERLPGPGDCDAEHYCWRWNTIGGLWARQPLTRSWYEFESHWLPAHALPLPEVGE